MTAMLPFSVSFFRKFSPAHLHEMFLPKCFSEDFSKRACFHLFDMCDTLNDSSDLLALQWQHFKCVSVSYRHDICRWRFFEFLKKNWKLQWKRWSFLFITPLWHTGSQKKRYSPNYLIYTSRLFHPLPLDSGAFYWRWLPTRCCCLQLHFLLQHSHRGYSACSVKSWTKAHVVKQWEWLEEWLTAH